MYISSSVFHVRFKTREIICKFADFGVICSTLVVGTLTKYYKLGDFLLSSRSADDLPSNDCTV